MAHSKTAREQRASDRGESGQILILLGILAVVLFGVIGLAVDVGRLYVMKAELSRAVDAAALAGVLELPDTTSACDKANAYIAANEPSIASSCTSPGSSQLRVTGSKSVPLYFLSVLGLHSTTVTAKATAGFGIQPIDAVIVLDTTQSMGQCSDDPPAGSGDSTPDSCPDGSACTTQVGCPIREAKVAAQQFVDTLMGTTATGFTAIGLVPERGCYRNTTSTGVTAWPKPSTQTNCVPRSQVQFLTTTKATITTAINNLTATGGSGTNICTGLRKAQDVLLQPPTGLGTGGHTASNTKRYIILLTDGDNRWDTYANQASPASPEAPCRPGTVSGSDSPPDCGADTAREAELDERTYGVSQTMKNAGQNVEIFVVAFGVCSPNTNACNSGTYTSPYTSGFPAGGVSDNIRDQNLLKCIASSPQASHYYNAGVATDLPAIFTAIAQQIAHRLIE